VWYGICAAMKWIVRIVSEHPTTTGERHADPSNRELYSLSSHLQTNNPPGRIPRLRPDQCVQFTLRAPIAEVDRSLRHYFHRTGSYGNRDWIARRLSGARGRFLRGEST
jgi:hypothetical protein